MRLNGIFGTGSGKTGNAVFATSAGKQIVRTYQPKVANPNTNAQIAQRAKFKLLSQLAAAMASVIVIPKDGLTSSRNLFVKNNYPQTGFADGNASIALQDIDLTASAKPLGSLDVEFVSETNKLNVAMNSSVVGLCEKVRYALFRKTDNYKLQLVSQKVVEVVAGSSEDASTEFDVIAGQEYVVYAYGMIAKRTANVPSYYNYETASGDTAAALETELSISVSNYNFTETLGLNVVTS